MWKTIIHRIRNAHVVSRTYSSVKNDRPDIKYLLNNAASFIDAKPATEEDEWATLPYAQGTVIPKREMIDENARPKMNPADTSLILFSGEGLQFGGMARTLISCPSARDIFEWANETLK